MYVHAQRACMCASSISLEMSILPYLNRNVELLNIRRGMSRFRAEYYSVHYAQLVCVQRIYARETLIILRGIVFRRYRAEL